MQLDLLSYTPPVATYPYTAGWKKTETSRLAAERADEDSWCEWACETAYFILKQTPLNGKKLLAEMRRRYPDKMEGRDILSLRPRLTKLKSLGLIEEVGRDDKQDVLGAL